MYPRSAEPEGIRQMPENGRDLEKLKQALDYDWPEIQKHLIGDGQGADSWWLKDFDRKDVLTALPGVVIMNTKSWHAAGVSHLLRRVYGVTAGEACDDCFAADDILAHIERFPVGQFMAMRISGPGAGQPIATAITMRASRPPTAPILSWRDAIGDMRLGAHEPDGEWLYGVEVAVDAMYRRHGIGTNLYQLRFELVKRLNLRGWYAVGMLMGYKDHAEAMDVREYGERVIAGEIKDPTVTMQLNRGFRAAGVVTDYCDEPAAADAGVLIVWDNPEYEEW